MSLRTDYDEHETSPSPGGPTSAPERLREPARFRRGVAEILLVASLGGVRRAEAERFRQALHEACSRPLVRRQAWRLRLSSAILVVLGLQVFTGIVLAVNTTPVAASAYGSVHAVDFEVTGGWFLRQLHVWSARALVVLVAAHLLRHFLLADYKAWGWLKWVAGVPLLVLLLAFHATGGVLPGGSLAIESTRKLAETLGAVPLAGPFIRVFLEPDRLDPQPAMTRAFVTHVVVLPWALLALVALAFSTLSRRGDVSPALDASPPSGRQRSAPLFPDRALEAAAFVAIVVGGLATLSVLLPAELGPPRETQLAAVPRNPVFHALAGAEALVVTLFGRGWAAPVAGMSLVVGLLSLLLVLPFFDRGDARVLAARKRIVAVGLGAFGFLLILQVIGMARS